MDLTVEIGDLEDVDHDGVVNLPDSPHRWGRFPQMNHSPVLRWAM
jgi:hypothetical protein